MAKLLNGWDESAQWFDQNMGQSGDDFNKNHIDPTFLTLLGPLKGKTVLDVGCGNGYFTAKIAKKAVQVTGYDYSAQAIRICHNKWASHKNLHFQQHDLTLPLPGKPNSCDLICAKMVLQYVPQIRPFVTSSYKLLKPKGKLVLAIDHPFHTQFWYAQQLAGKPNPKYPGLSHYFNTYPQTKISLWGKSMLTWYPRTVSFYLNTFIKAGYTLDETIELPETKNNISHPRVLLASFIKSKNNTS